MIISTQLYSFLCFDTYPNGYRHVSGVDEARGVIHDERDGKSREERAAVENIAVVNGSPQV